ncbi:hypothetical protein WICPIJ_005978 [Wickerhamomyces pijperi]|uniref:1,3-beta-glucanosyltransferase n=1 Tax=Wickerhamomyces pijperi TaxID=599730 RepID=A0A9P8Q4P1_WICPI|nr:hypothetical protein WICPIJ_005978 [Wickerhamomyces pijperi]
MQLINKAITFSSLFGLIQANSDKSGTDVSIPTIEVVGNKFFYSNNGSQFYIRGVAYQQDTSTSTTGATFIDPLADYEACKRDLPYLLNLHTNVLRVYAVDTTVSHKKCMDLFATHGIYIIADLSQPSESVNRDSPAWDVPLYKRYTDVVDALSNYTNVLGFFAGNEVSNNASNTDASAFVKAAVRDVKSYVKKQGYRTIPVGYSTNDDAEIRVQMADYFACGDQEEKVDFYGINMYEWCGTSTFEKSGYKDRTDEFRNISVPVFFSEYGCNEVRPREFTDVGTLYSSKMTDVWSGGIVYMYFEEANQYGLITLDKSGHVSTLEDFNYLRSELGKISPTSATKGSVTATSLACPAEDEYWRASTDLPPTPDQDLCSCSLQGFGCVVSDDIKSEDYGDLFGMVCGLVDCGDISTNGTSGEYGMLSFCDDKTKLSFLLNKYYENRGKHSTDCSFDGSATLGSAKQHKTCQAVLSSASASGRLGSSTAGGSSTSRSSAIKSRLSMSTTITF